MTVVEGAWDEAQVRHAAGRFSLDDPQPPGTTYHPTTYPPCSPSPPSSTGCRLRGLLTAIVFPPYRPALLPVCLPRDTSSGLPSLGRRLLTADPAAMLAPHTPDTTTTAAAQPPADCVSSSSSGSNYSGLFSRLSGAREDGPSAMPSTVITGQRVQVRTHSLALPAAASYDYISC